VHPSIWFTEEFFHCGLSDFVRAICYNKWVNYSKTLWRQEAFYRQKLKLVKKLHLKLINNVLLHSDMLALIFCLTILKLWTVKPLPKIGCTIIFLWVTQCNALQISGHEVFIGNDRFTVVWNMIFFLSTKLNKNYFKSCITPTEIRKYLLNQKAMVDWKQWDFLDLTYSFLQRSSPDSVQLRVETIAFNSLHFYQNFQPIVLNAASYPKHWVNAPNDRNDRTCKTTAWTQTPSFDFHTEFSKFLNSSFHSDEFVIYDWMRMDWTKRTSREI